MISIFVMPGIFLAKFWAALINLVSRTDEEYVIWITES